LSQNKNMKIENMTFRKTVGTSRQSTKATISQEDMSSNLMRDRLQKMVLQV